MNFYNEEFLIFSYEFVQINIPKFNQRRLCMIKYLGEMYNYRVVDSIIIFRTLYLLITYGVSLDGKYSQA